MRTKGTAAIVGPGNIGTDLMFKLMRRSDIIEPRYMIGVDPQSDGLRRAKSVGLEASAEGVDWLLAQEELPDIVFECTSAKAHEANAPRYAEAGILAVDLTPAAVGPYLCPPVNLEFNLDAMNVNMITCGGQATTPMVKAVSSVVPVPYAEIVASISSLSAGPGTRANIDEFTETTSAALEVVGGAERGKAIIILNPADPPMLMRDTVFTLSQGGSEVAIRDSVAEMVRAVQSYVPGYRLKQEIQFEHIGDNAPLNVPGIGRVSGLKTSIFLEVEGNGDYFPGYAGNLDIMTSAAKAAAESWVRAQDSGKAA